MDIFEQIESGNELQFPVSSSKNGGDNVKKYLPTAYQIICIKKVVSLGSTKAVRQIIDTIEVKNGMVEAAKNQAVSKAKKIGNCMVIELCERSVIEIGEPPERLPDVYKQGRKAFR